MSMSTKTSKWGRNLPEKHALSLFEDHMLRLRAKPSRKTTFVPRQQNLFLKTKSYCWLYKSRNTKGKIYGSYSGNIYGMYKEYIRNIHKYLWYKIIGNTGTAFGGGRRMGLCFWLLYIIDIYGYSLYILYIFHIDFLAMFHIFSLVCLLPYGVKSKSGHDRSQSFWFNFACFGFKTEFLTKFLDDSAWFCLEKLKNHVFSLCVS